MNSLTRFIAVVLLLGCTTAPTMAAINYDNQLHSNNFTLSAETVRQDVSDRCGGDCGNCDQNDDCDGDGQQDDTDRCNGDCGNCDQNDDCDGGNDQGNDDSN